MTIDFLQNNFLIHKPFPSSPYLLLEAGTAHIREHRPYVIMYDTNGYVSDMRSFFEIDVSKLETLKSWIPKERFRTDSNTERELMRKLWTKYHNLIEREKTTEEDFFKGFEKELNNWKKTSLEFYIEKYNYVV
jgi:ABC-type transporter lipoprotein component MlaA